MQDEPPPVVARLGGWKNVETMRKSYPKANAEMMVDVPSHRVYRAGRKRTGVIQRGR